MPKTKALSLLSRSLSDVIKRFITLIPDLLYDVLLEATCSSEYAV
jgi:predicted ATPase